jgi:hypothetical protein
MRFPDCLIGVMAKAPVPGQAKTRLIPALGEEGAAKLHAYLTERLLTELTAAQIAPITLYCTPDTGHPFFQHCESHYGLRLEAQKGEGLGERLYHAMVSGLQHSRATILIGCDIPLLGADDLVEGFEALQGGDNAVISPTEDGGYALIGMTQAVQQPFTDIAWGSEQVLSQTQNRFTSLGWRWKALTQRWDVDQPEDLRRLADLSHPPEIQRLLSAAH